MPNLKDGKVSSFFKNRAIVSGSVPNDALPSSAF